ncbi:hypothetical protein QO002_004353 [Pararhizobium capsulatum DSM 1112]|uniref:Uncharacterized protein n=1 Tax=Pararhizobium capsulatum DSM 1112 TaxID=1121113 RepID=A0ABU0BZ81_9HYPH|nr:hypothetical protein [Pararhizobium capsulatum]MDQ0322147.1 hypothetical protein [Pararhizobium capsulatum DSM 1112]
MVVEIKVGTVEAKLTAMSPDVLLSSPFLNEVTRLVKEEMKRDQALDKQRANDKTMVRPAPGRSL